MHLCNGSKTRVSLPLFVDQSVVFRTRQSLRPESRPRSIFQRGGAAVWVITDSPLSNSTPELEVTLGKKLPMNLKLSRWDNTRIVPDEPGGLK